MSNQEIAYPDSPRIGKFNILREVLQDGRERSLLQALFAVCVVLEAYPNESGRGTTYIAASELFQPLAEGEEIPEYRIECAWPDQQFRNPDHELDCVRSGEFRFRAVRQIVVRVPAVSMSIKPNVVH